MMFCEIMHMALLVHKILYLYKILYPGVYSAPAYLIFEISISCRTCYVQQPKGVARACKRDNDTGDLLQSRMLAAQFFLVLFRLAPQMSHLLRMQGKHLPDICHTQPAEPGTPVWSHILPATDFIVGHAQ